MSKKKYIIISIIVISISLIALIGTSYALLTMTIEGDKKVSLTAGILKVDFSEGDNINLDNTAPLTDKQGLKTTPYTFTITNTGNINAYYHVSLEEDANNTLSNSYLKMKITGDNGYDSGIIKVNNYGEGSFEIIGEDPNNYIWYSGKLWRAVSVNNEEKTVKLVTQWNISFMSYDNDSSAFEGSYIEAWLNDTTVDGFLSNLRNYENFIVTDAVWDATEDNRELGSITRPNGTTVVTDAVGLLNIYEYQTSYRGADYSTGYLKNGLDWWIITPYNSSYSLCIASGGNNSDSSNTIYRYGVRPSINLKSDIKIVSGSGTEDDPYRLLGDNDEELSGIKLNTRYSGEYVRFGTGDNNLYRIVSHETRGLTKITSADPLKENGAFKTISYGDDVNYLFNNTIGTFLNGEFINNYVTSLYSDMIENDTTWYLGEVRSRVSYKLAKYVDENMSSYTTSTNTKVGLLRFGELMSGQFGVFNNNTAYWLLTPYATGLNHVNVYSGNTTYITPSNNYIGIKPALNLKSNVIITSGDGTKEDPFKITLAE